MKNIHVLKTDKPSRLYIGDNGNFVFGMIQTSIQSRNNDFTNQNIYITSDEEIKEGDWIFDLDVKRVVNADNLKVATSKKSQCWYYKKIILTTDQDLIKDSVQPIDDEFLEWFVKNPSCEGVEVKDIRTIPALQLGSPNGHLMYKIIIPKEHSKEYTNGYVLATSAINNGGDPQELLIQSRSSLTFDDFDKGWKNACKEFIPKEELKPHSFCETPNEKCTMNYCDENGCQNRKRELVEPKSLTDLEIAIKLEEIEREEPKQETLEDRVKRLSEGHNLQTTLIAFANVGAEWQAEKMYSEEEVGRLCSKAWLKSPNTPNMLESFDKWFEQFKKK